MHGNFRYAAGMASTLELRVQECVDNGKSQLRRDEPGGKHKHIGIVVAACQRSKLGVPAQSGTYPLMLI